MTYWRQPWGRLRVGGQSCRLQVLDPEAAFALEPELIRRLGDPLLLAIADPSRVTSTIGAHASESAGGPASLLAGLRDSAVSIDVAAEGLRAASSFVAEGLRDLDLDGQWLARVFSRIVLGRFELEGREIGDWVEWSRAGLSWHARWLVLGTQIEQTFGPLWRRSPYKAGGRKAESYGVPEVQQPVAIQWAGELARQGFGSTHEILTTWTPDRMVDHVEQAAQRAEHQRRASEAARNGAG